MKKIDNRSITINLLMFSSFILLFFAVFFNEYLIDLTNPHHPLLEITRLKIRQAQFMFFVAFIIIFASANLIKKIKGLKEIKDIVPNLLLSLLIIFLPIFILENVLNPFVRRKTTIFMEDSHLGWKLRPNSFDYWGGVKMKVNEKGLTGPVLEYKKPKDIKRILFLGNSVTFGYMLEDHKKTFPFLVQSYINRKMGRKCIQCINAAVGGYSPWQEFIYLENEGVKYNPDLVVIGFVLNDITEKFLLKRFGGIGIGSQLQETIEKKGNWLKQNSNIYIALTNFIARLRYGRDIKKGAVRKEILNINTLINNPNRDDVLKAWEITLTNLEKIILFCKEENIKVLLVVFPFTFQFDNILELSLPQKRMHIFAEQHQIPFIDMLPIYNEKIKSQSKNISDYFLDQNHLLYKGNVVVAETIVSYIFKSNLLMDFP